MIINRENSIQAGLDKDNSADKRRRRQLQCTGHLSDLLRGDCIGAVILYSRENQTRFSETEYKAAACAASFLGKQMEG